MYNLPVSKKDIVSFNQEVGERGDFSNEGSLDFALGIAGVKRNWLYELTYLVRSLLVDHVFQDGNKRTCLLLVIYYFDQRHLPYDREKLLTTLHKITKNNISNPVLIARLLYHVIREKD